MPTPKRYADAAARQRAYRQRQAQSRLVERRQKELPALPAIATQPGERRWQALVELAQSSLSSVHSEMQSYYEERSEVWQEGERGESFLERIDTLEALLSELDSFQQSYVHS